MDRKLIEEFDKKEKARKHKFKQKSSKEESKKHKKETEISQPSSSYRDRAQERREGLNRDFEYDPDDLKIFNPIVEGSLYGYDNDTFDEEARRKQEIEDSKYLGGDVKHTHLVKGLDFALLEKVKSDQKNDDGHDLGSDSEEEEFRMEAILAASGGSKDKRQIIDVEKLKKGQSTEVIPCKTALARRILNVLDEKWPSKSELFLPGRMSYVIPVDEDTDATLITIIRSKT